MLFQSLISANKALKMKRCYLLLAPFHYITQDKGKQVRRRILIAINNWLQIDDDKLNMIYDITDMLHNASLLVDDVEDNSILRRGHPVAHHIFGIKATVNSANLVYFLAFERLLNSFTGEKYAAKAAKIFVSKLLELHLGQGLDIYWRDRQECPTEKQYLQMVYQKTGGGLEMCIQLMQLFSGNKRARKQDYSSHVMKAAQFYQIRDDYANLVSTEYKNAKGYCEDLTEGKYSFPLIHAIQNNLLNQQVLEIIKQKPESAELKKQIVDQLRACGSLDYSRSKLLWYKDVFRKKVNRFKKGNELLLSDEVKQELIELSKLLGNI